jgi:DNA-directed RNA polymerase specialized sigma24 family protein
VLIDRADKGDGTALAALFGHYRKRLWQIVRSRLERRLRGRVDASDVLQEAERVHSQFTDHAVN